MVFRCSVTYDTLYFIASCKVSHLLAQVLRLLQQIFLLIQCSLLYGTVVCVKVPHHMVVVSGFGVKMQIQAD